MSSLRILVIDDEPSMVGAIAALVGSAGHRVVAAYSGEEAIARYDEEHPDLVLLDLAMPTMDGVAVSAAIRGRGRTPIIVISGESDEAAKVEVLDLGADDYVTKPFGKDELLARIRAVMRRAEAGAGGTTPARSRRIIEIDPDRHEARVRGAVLDLTRTEYRLLAAMVAADGRLVSHAQLLQAGWPEEADPDPLWPKPHLTRLRRKLRAAGAPQPQPVRGVGYRLIDPPPPG